MDTSTPKQPKDMTPDERRAHRAAIKKKSYHARKNDPGRREAVNEENLARYHAKKGDPGFLEVLRVRVKERYDLRKNDPEAMRALSEKCRRNGLKRMWDGIVRGAIKRAIAKGIPYDTDLLEWAPTVWTGRCALSGIEFKRTVGSGPNPYSPSIDRIIPSLGYTKGNCRFILHGLNAMKGSGTDETMWEIMNAALSQRDRS